MSGVRSPSPGLSPSGRNRASRRGSALLYVIASIVLLGTIGGGVAYFSSSSSTSNIAKTAHNQAYYAAVSGVQYAREANLESIENSTVTYSLGSGTSFKLTVGAKAASVYPVTVCGIYGSGTSMEANHQLPQMYIPAGGYDINLPGDPAKIAGANSAHGSAVAQQLIAVVKEGHPEYTGTEYVRLGNRTTQGYACIWFNDSKSVNGDDTYCQNGVCKFGTGMRFYFEFQVASAGADGFTISLLNAQNNSVNDCGGDLSMGELLGYAGTGVSGHGLRPAKIAVEFDTYQNGSGDCDEAGSRNDDDDGHIAYVYWGTIDGDFWGDACKTYDDNIHGIDGGSNSGNYTVDGSDFPGRRRDNPLYNTSNLDNDKLKSGSNITYKRVTNLEDNAVHTFRMEILRNTNANGSGAYTLKSWIDCKVGGLPCEGLEDLDADLTVKAPDLVSSFTMAKYFHNLFNTFLLGFTEATGANAQEVRLMNFRLRFRE